MEKLPTLCVTLLVVTSGQSEGETPLTVNTVDSRSDQSPRGKMNNSQMKENFQDRLNNNQLGENLWGQAQNSQPDRSFNFQTYSQPKEWLQYQTNKSKPEYSLQYQTKSMFISTIDGHHTDYNTIASVQPDNSVNQLSTMQTAKQRLPTGRTLKITPQSATESVTSVRPSGTVSHTLVGEGAVWSEVLGFYSVDLAACDSTQLHDIVIPLEEEGERMKIHWRTPGVDKDAETDSPMYADFTCEFRVVAKDSRFLSGKLYELQLSGGVEAGLNVTIAGGKKTQHLYQSVGGEFICPMVFTSLSSELVFTFQSSVGDHRGKTDSNRQTLKSADVTFNFLLTPQSGYQLENRRPSSGIIYITTFGFDSKTHYAHDTDDTVHFIVSAIMISFPHFDLQDSPQCQADRLTLSKLQYTTKGAPEYTEIWSQCGNRYIPAQVYDHHLALHFVSDSSHSGTGFQMLYTTHPLSQLPQQLDSGLFNCSVPKYPDFHFHFHCNLERECVAGEDEADCPYTSTDCGSDHIHVHNKCYLYLPVRRKMTWYDARELCQRHERKLASLQREGDLDTVFKAPFKKKTSPVYINFAMSPTDADALFGGEMRLSNDSLVLNPAINDSDQLTIHCAYLPAMVTRPRQGLTTRAIPCNSSLYIHYTLCEKENTTTYRSWTSNKIQKQIQWWTVANSSVHVNLTACSKTLGVTSNISVEDGMTLEARKLPNESFFVCHMTLVGRHHHYIATVIEKYEVEMDAGLAKNGEAHILFLSKLGRNSQKALYHWPNYEQRDFEHAFLVACNQSSILFTLQSEGSVRSIYLRLRILVTPEPGARHLSHLFVPPQGGILTSFAFDGLTRYAHDTTAIYKIDAYGVMVTFTHFDLVYDQGCRFDKLYLLILKQFADLENMSHRIQWSKCGREDIPPGVYRTKVVFWFVTGSAQAATGFRLKYSTHTLFHLPRMQYSLMFNCSVPHYPDFRLHFHCNLEHECVAGEDEADCPYTSTDCGADHIDAGNKCYLYLPVRHEMTWYDASQLCRSHGERLVSPRTPREWSKFRTITDYGMKTFGVFVGLSTSPSSLQAMYREVWRWEDQTMAFYLNAHGQKLSKPTCAYLPPIYRDMLEPIRCEDQIYVRYVLCETDKVPASDSHLQIGLSDLSNTVWPDHFLYCPQRHVTHSFLSCDFHAKCGTTKQISSCSLLGRESVPMFECDSGSETVHYSLVCDHRHDCADGSDENWCQHAPCGPLHEPCRNQQCVLQSDWCDGVRHCIDGSDEDCLQFVQTVVPSVPPPAVVILDGYGGYDIRALDTIQQCPVTHFRCSPRDYCLPVYLHCNGVHDCPGHEDEEQCDSYVCPGFYHCRASSVCVHSQHVCDGVFQCPQQDDEWLCNSTCPKGCRCQGLAFICNQSFPVHAFPSIRYLDASGSGMRPRDLEQNHFLVRLSLSQCDLTAVDNMTLPNLRWLDLSANTLTSVSMQTFAGLTNLRVLLMTNNPLTSLVPIGVDTRHLNLHVLDLSLTTLMTYHGQSLTGFSSLTHLNISHGTLTTISEQGLNATPSLQVLDVRGSQLENFPQHLLRDLASIHTVFADNFKLCCPAMLSDGFNPNNCHAPLDEIASCDDLLRSDAYRASLWFMAVMALVGNAGSFVYRVLQREAAKTGFHVFVSNLCLADFLMGLYLTVIGAADAVYRGEYLWKDKLWKDSAACQVAGFLSLLSSEMSAFFICLITLDRYIVLRFPFSQVRFHPRSALAASALAWTGGCLLALVPLLPMTSHWRFYSQTGICIPLPITRATFKGRAYSFGVMVVFNFVLFVLIVLGQLLVFLSVRMNSMTGSCGNQDAIIARRLTTIVLTDFLCWFPIGLLGLLASTGTPISSELNVGMAIFVLPFNSALNPFLYTFNVFMEKRQKTAQSRLLETLKRQAGIR